MTVNERHFLRFIRFALMGGDYPHGMLTEAAWREQQKLAKEQTVSGLFYNTVSQLPRELRPPGQMLAKLNSKVVYYESMNKLLNQCVCETFETYRKLGFHPILLKGPAAASLYEFPEHRVFGDIDIYVQDPDGRLYAWLQKNAENVRYAVGKPHLMSFVKDGVIIENHLYLIKFYNRKLAQHMDEILAEAFPKGTEPTTIQLGDEQIEVLPRTLGLLYDIVHFSKHLITSGVGLRQLCDITMAMHRYHNDIDSDLLCRWLDKLEMRHMANAVAAAAVRYLGLPDDEVPFDYRSDQFWEKADNLMGLVMDSANFGYWLKRGKRRSWWTRVKKNLRQYIRLYPYMPREVRTEMWLAITHRLYL